VIAAASPLGPLPITTASYIRITVTVARFASGDEVLVG
jgi:hypothetical protein